MKLAVMLSAAPKKMSIQDFIQARLDGATKIAKEARAKGGAAVLTAIHFEAKLPAYMQMLTKCDKAGIEANVAACEKMLAGKTTMQQFQQLTGKQEAWGEVLHYLEHPIAL
jgi:hypothetical protein